MREKEKMVETDSGDTGRGRLLETVKSPQEQGHSDIETVSEQEPVRASTCELFIDWKN